MYDTYLKIVRLSEEAHTSDELLMDTEKQFNKQLNLNNCETKNKNKLLHRNNWAISNCDKNTNFCGKNVLIIPFRIVIKYLQANEVIIMSRIRTTIV